MIRVYANSTHEIRTQNAVDVDDFVFYNSPFKEMIDASLKHNVRGKRRNVFFTYEASIQPSEWTTMVNDVVSHLSNYGYIRIEFDGGTDRFVLREGFEQKVKYANQMGRFIPTLELTGQEMGSVTVIFMDYGLITEAVTSTEDYGLITQLVTSTEDYGTL